MKRKSSTERMIETLGGTGESSYVSFPPEFLSGLRGALEAGLSCEELTALLILFTGIYEAGEKMSGVELIQRAEHLSSVMRGDIDNSLREQERSRKSRERKVLLKKKKF